MPPTITTTTTEASIASQSTTISWTVWLAIGIAVFILLVLLVILFFVGKHYYEKRKQTKAAAKVQKQQQQKGTKEKSSIDSVQQLKSQNPSQQLQQCSSSAAADEAEKKSKKKLKKRFKETTAEEDVEPPMNTTVDQKEPEIKEFSAKGDENDEVEDIEKLTAAEKNQKVQDKNVPAENVNAENEVAKKKQEKFLKEKMECMQKVKEMFETPEWDRKHMPPECDFKLFSASSPMLRFCTMEYLKSHADKILTSHGYKIYDGRADAPRTAFQWLRSSEISENDEFLKSRAWMLENWSTFKRSPSTEWPSYETMEVPLLYMAAMKDTINETEVLDKILKQILLKAADYFNSTEKKDWQIQDHPMKIMARIFEDGKSLELAASSLSLQKTEKVEAKN